MSLTPSTSIVVPKLKRHTMEVLLTRGVRLDGRKLDDIREIKIEPGYIERAEGSALVKLGETMVLVGVKMDIVPPFPDTPNEGVLVINAEFVPLASPTFEPGPPDENAIELARVIDRSLREIKAVALDKLVLEPGKHVWRIYVDIYVLNHDGNLFDASALASMAALMTTRVPQAVKVEEGYVVDRSRYTSLLPINHRVVTVAIAKLASKLIVDPTYEEEEVADTRLVVAVSDDGRVAGIQKTGGTGYLTYDEVLRAVSLALRKASVYFEALKKFVEPYRLELEKKLGESEKAQKPEAELPRPLPSKEREEVVEEIIHEEVLNNEDSNERH